MEPVLLRSDNRTLDYCCRDNTTFLQLLGEGCFERWLDVRRYYRSCSSWSPWTNHTCHQGMVKVYRVCLVSRMSCVIREFHKRLCNTHEILPLCSDSQNSC